MYNYRFETAVQLTKQGQSNRAIVLLKELLAEDPNDAVLHGILAENLINTGRIHAAEYELKLALGLEPSIAFLYVLGARVSYLKNKTSDALEQCDQALSLDVENIGALLLKSQIYRRLDKHKDALICVDEAARISPENFDIDTTYGELKLERGELDKAYGFAAQALSKDAQNIDANVLMGEVQLAKGDIDEAEYHAKLAIMLNPDEEAALRLLVNIKTRKNWLFGLWWRFNNAVSSMSNFKSTIVLISAYLFFTSSAQVLADFGYSKLAIIVSMTWLTLVIYTWVGIPYYQRILKKELEKFTFDPKF